MNEYGKGFGSGVLAETVGSAATDATTGLAEMGAAITMPRLPEKKFRVRGLTATVWKSISPQGTAYYNVQLDRSYKDKDNNWKKTSSLKENDIPKAMVLLQKAYEYVIQQSSSLALN